MSDVSQNYEQQKKLQSEKAEKFLALHNGEDILILPNIWDPLGAMILEHIGFSAAATASAAISSSLGYRDGENIKYTDHLNIIASIAGAVSIPVTADIESGYAADLQSLEQNILSLLRTGAAGINIEDSIKEKSLRSIEEQAGRLRTVRKIASNENIPLVINARTDYFLINRDDPESSLIKNLVERAQAYKEAGADCFYPVGVSDKKILVQLRKEIPYPINVLGSPASLSINALREIGINRVSFGPFVFRTVMKKFRDIASELFNSGTFAGNMFTRDEIEVFLKDEEE